MAKWKTAWHFFVDNFVQVVLGLVLTLVWIQMYPCLYGFDSVMDIESISYTRLLALTVVNGNKTEIPFENPMVKKSSPPVPTLCNFIMFGFFCFVEKLMGPYTFACALVLFLVAVVYVAPISIIIFCVCSSVVTVVCMIAQGVSVVMYNSLQVMPIISWIPIVYVRVNILSIFLIYIVFGMRLLKKICGLHSCQSNNNATDDDQQALQSSDDDTDDDDGEDRWMDCENANFSTAGWMAASTPLKKSDTAPGKKAKQVGRNGIFTPTPLKRWDIAPKRLRTSNVHSIDIQQGTAKTAALTRAIANVLAKFNFKTKDYKVQSVEGEYGTKHFVGFPDYPPVIKPDGLPNTSPNIPKNITLHI
ncbi:hypothetical protein Ocin01_13987 [Orchesella cincta]|uniref:Uncharacterized protein n=1 Tax=Orchesella cincta TaxID=48709 RepID=A0A1D2MI77_ORCCI|nr:hypothetical protein Ocin01_13987 [Orchesella cincta]